jgi:hypothetical protein
MVMGGEVEGYGTRRKGTLKNRRVKILVFVPRPVGFNTVRGPENVHRP